jgi:HK97 gp10 family phage protein
MANRERLLAKMAAIPAEIRKEIAKAVREGADEIVRVQKSLAPVRTGALRDSIVATQGAAAPAYSTFRGGQGGGESDPELSVTISAGNTKVRYAHLQEFGTAPHENGGIFAGSEHPGNSPSPFFFPGYRATRRRVKGRITRATKKAIKKAAGL